MRLGKLLFSLVIVSLLVSMALPIVSAKGPKPPPPPPPPADPAIAFFKQSTSRNADRLMVMNADGTNQAVIYEDYFRPDSISWSPDGKSIAWSCFTYIPNVPGGWVFGVWRIDVEIVDSVPQGSNPQQLVSSDTGMYSAAWSPLGDEIAYSRTRFTPNGSFIDRIDAVPATGGDPYTIYTSPKGWGIRAGSSVTWRSDGTQLAFTRFSLSGAGEVSIIIIDRETGSIVDTLLTGQQAEWVDWAQDLDILAFTVSDTNMMYTVDIETDVVEPVTDGWAPSWSPDNSKLVYVQTQQPRGKGPLISTVDLDTGETTKLASGSGRPDWRRF